MFSQTDLTDDPVFIDLETRSACDLPTEGGWNYAKHPTTQLLTVAWSPAAGEYHVWYPWHTIREDYIAAQATKTINHFGPDLPAALEGVLHRRWCAHNAWNFDSLVWAQLFGELQQPDDWIDTEPLARAVGLPGGLDAIGKRLWGEGKYLPGKTALKKHSKGATRYGDAADVPAGIMPMIAEYNVQDVVLMRGVWEEIVRWLRLPQEEWQVLHAHRTVNDRGAAIDTDLMLALIDLTEEGRSEAVKQIAELTRGMRVELRTINDLQSRPTMLRWLDEVLLTARFTVTGKDSKRTVSLRKELVQQFIDVHTSAEDGEDEAAPDDEEGEEEDSTEHQRDVAAKTALAVRVLQLRGAALRITGGKLAAAAAAVGEDGRIRGLFVYAGAHTFRWAGRRVQVHNLPRPKEGLAKYKKRFPLWEMIERHERRDRSKSNVRGLTYKVADELLPDRSERQYRFLTPDDAASALVRGLFWAGEETSGTGAEARVVDWRTSDDPLGIIAADLSGIEARVLAWLAGEEWLMKAFWNFADPYITMAEAVFGPRTGWPNYDPSTLKKHPYRQVGKIVELGSGYQLGGMKMNLYAAANGIDLAENNTSGPECVMAYRRAHPAIAGEYVEKTWWDRELREEVTREVSEGGLWRALADAAKLAALGGGPVKVGVGAEVVFDKEGPHVMLYLPSGRRMIYRNARINPNGVPPYLKGKMDANGRQRTVEVFEYLSPRYGWVHMYGGKWAENVVQGTSRDFLAHSIVNLEAASFPIVVHVHDEAGGEGRLSRKAEYMSIFTTPPVWAKNFPLDAEGGWQPRYSKSAPPGERYAEEVWRNGQYVKRA